MNPKPVGIRQVRDAVWRFRSWGATNQPRPGRRLPVGLAAISPAPGFELFFREASDGDRAEPLKTIRTWPGAWTTSDSRSSIDVSN